ncbi:MAG: NAD(P)-dependent oxidoreductase [Chloroflexota bacterium]
MKILLTGAFGNVGQSVLHEAKSHEFTIRCFDLKTKSNLAVAKKVAKSHEVIWGDIRNPEDVKQALDDQDVVIHLAAIIPPISDQQPALAKAVNVDGTINILNGIQGMAKPAKLIYSSSLALFGQTQHLPPPRTIRDPLIPTDAYTHHKATCETLIKDTKIDWTILRFAAVLPLALLNKVDPIMFEIPLTDRIELVHTYDVGRALLNAAAHQQVSKKTFLIGGGARCQLYQREVVEKGLKYMGIGMLPDTAFGNTPYHTDWLDTEESQRVLNYQRYTYDDYLQHMSKKLGFRRQLVVLISPIIRFILLRQSPYYQHTKRNRRGQSLKRSVQ